MYNKKRYLAAPLVGTLLLLCYHWIYSDFFPAINGNIGHDYSYFLPMLLDGYYWYLNNGIFSPQWFTPSFCGGLPAFANPQNLYYSFPQWLSFITNPLSAAYTTNLMFAAIGFVGFYLLLHSGFKTSKSTALLGATLFLFNGFYATRMMIGHLTYHSFMIIPLLAYLLLHKRPTKNFHRTALYISFAAMLFSYMIYSGAIHLIIPAIFVLIFIGLLHNLLYKWNVAFWLKLALSGILGIILSLPKLSSAVAFISNFERNDYLLPGADSISGLLQLVFETLFFQPSAQTVKEVIVNAQWGLGRHELEYGISLVPLLIIIAGIFFASIKRPSIKNIAPHQWACIIGLGIILLIPFALNIYSPSWNALLKQTPVLGSSSTLIRWFSIYIPIVILVSSITMEKITWLNKYRHYISIAGIISVVFITSSIDRDYYANQPYSPATITAAYQDAINKQKPPIIRNVFAFINENGTVSQPVFRNDVLANGASQLLCYEPVFGYRLENLPLQPLKIGRVDARIDGIFNLKNPACYVFPNTNNCQPGDHFKTTEAKEAAAFISYKPFTFIAPRWQEASNMASLILLIVILGFWTLYPVAAYFCNKNKVDTLPNNSL